MAAYTPTLIPYHGFNEFSVALPEPPLLKFATIYEFPLILLLTMWQRDDQCNYDDAISITVAALIVLTGMNCCNCVGKVELMLNFS